MGIALIQILDILLTVAIWLVIAQGILSWLIAFNVINTSNELIRNIWIALDRITEPVYRPIRRVMPDLGALDLSPMVVLIGLVILRGPILGAMARALIAY